MEDNLQCFHAFRKELDEKHDKWERIVKMSRDITVESKRLIFHLHRLKINSKFKDLKIMTEAEEKSKIIRQKWKQIALELSGDDAYIYVRAYSPGLQEYIEAMAFLHYFTMNSFGKVQNPYEGLIPLETLQSLLTFGEEDIPTDITEKLVVPIPVLEYLLGIADTTGEIMRLCISSVAHALSDPEAKREVSKLCSYIRALYDTFESYSSLAKESLGQQKVLRGKIYTMKSSLHKVEEVCYILEVRGQEIPQHILEDGKMKSEIFSLESEMIIDY